MTVVTIPAAGQYGFVADQPPQELPPNAYSYVRNVRFRDGMAERFAGEVQVFSATSVIPYFVMAYGTPTKRYWIHAGLAAIYADDGTTRTDVTGTAPTGAIDDRWTGGTLGGIALLNNGVDVPQFWAGDTSLNFATLTGWDSSWRAKSVRPFKAYIVAVGITKGSTVLPHMVKWSAAADPGTIPASWDASDATIDAGELDLAETPDLIVDQLVMGDVNIIYKEQSMYVQALSGDNNIFTFRRIPGNYGMLYRGCAADTPKGHVVLANGDVVLHQGQGEPQSLLVGRAKKWLFSRIDSTQYKRCFVVSNPTKNEVWVCYPTAGATSCTEALVWNWVDNTLGIRTLSNVTYASAGLLDYSQGNTWADYAGLTWAEVAASWNQNDYTPADSRLIMASTSSKLLLADARTAFDLGPVNAVLERTGMAFDDPSRFKTLRSIVPRIDAVAGTVVQISFGASNDAEQAPIYGAPISYTVGTTRKADGFISGRFLSYKIESTTNQPWRVKSIDFDIVMGGLY